MGTCKRSKRSETRGSSPTRCASSKADEAQRGKYAKGDTTNAERTQVPTSYTPSGRLAVFDVRINTTQATRQAGRGLRWVSTNGNAKRGKARGLANWQGANKRGCLVGLYANNKQQRNAATCFAFRVWGVGSPYTHNAPQNAV